MKQFLLFFCITCFLTSFGQAAGDTVYKPVVYPKGYESQIDLVYTKLGDWEGRLDLYFAKNPNKPTPLIINIHGGGWNHGVKEGQGGFNTYFKAGFAVANIEYRLTGQAKAPAAIEDTRCALIYLVNNAKRFNIDPMQIIFLGGSAGGHLALMGGLLGINPIFDANCKWNQPFKVVAIIDKYGINDVGDWAYGPNITSKSATNWLGDKAKNEAFIKSVSPVNYLTKDSPPIFIVHGNADPTVSYQQSVTLHKKLNDLGVKNEFVTIDGGVHGKFTKEQNDQINKSILQFLESCKIPFTTSKIEFN